MTEHMNRAQRRRAERERNRPAPPEPRAPRPPKVDLFVYGVGCTWWDSIDNAATYANGLPCCPHCGSLLYQTSPQKWWIGVELEDAKRPGYRGQVEWMRGRCFPGYGDAAEAYREEQSRV